IGRYCIIVSQSGIAGSSTIGDGVTIAAQSGVANHASVGDGVTMGARSGVIGDIEAHKTVSGFPAREHKLELRQMASLRRLADMADEIKALKKKISALGEDLK
ncbi:MAG: UDP-3-O-(3-hydroxymyristoyl)glucosamine N-acyltransferase, partial [Synergistaceae bacterium]|nr:UDP-3-O-(3-hydroxymyristoyl)glucosamine N-acyltransferase [Synergistaceae bacterium]